MDPFRGIAAFPVFAAFPTAEVVSDLVSVTKKRSTATTALTAIQLGVE